MIQDALSQKVAPVFTAAFNHMSSQHSQLESRFTALEQEVKTLKIRCAWLEKDLMQNQIEVAKRTIISRNWPEWMTAEDRALSIRNGLQAAGLDAALTDIYTPQFHRENDVISLGAVTIITVPNFNSRKLFMNYNSSRVQCFYYKKVVKEVDMQPEEVPPQGMQGQALTDWEAAQKEAKEKKQKEPVTLNVPTEWGAKAKLAPGITQMERRIGAPMHGLMNAYAAAFPKYKGQSLIPRWKTLILTDADNCWLGRLKYARTSRTINTSSQATVDWECIIQLPAEHAELLKKTWKDLWYSQLYTQIEQTDSEDKALTALAAGTAENYKDVQRLTHFMKKAKPAWDEGKEEGVEEWVARFKWEYPWKVSFEELPEDHADRKHFTDLPQVEDLMKEMATATAEMELDSNLTQAQAKDPTGDTQRSGSQKREGGSSSSQATARQRKEQWDFNSQGGWQSQSADSSHYGKWQRAEKAKAESGWVDWGNKQSAQPYGKEQQKEASS